MKSDFCIRIEKAAQSIHDRYKTKLHTAVILGSGLSDAARAWPGTLIPFSEIAGFPAATVQGHSGMLKLSEGKLFMMGRFHYYEGHSPEDLMFPVFVLHTLGVKTLIVTNAAGSLSKKLKPGVIVIIKDHINLLGISPLRGQQFKGLGPRFPDMEQAYSEELIRTARKLCKELKKQGVYACVPGPHYETQAEAKMLRTLGVDMVGMSTVPEVLAARFLGMRIFGLSCITNYTAGVSKTPLDHDKVLAVSKAMTDSLARILEKLLRYLEKEFHDR